MRRLRFVLPTLILGLVTGCGGGGGGTAPVIIPATGQSTVVTAAQGAILYQSAQANSEPAVFPKGAGASVSEALYAWLGEYSVRAFDVSREPANWTAIPGTPFYFKAGPTTLTTTSILLSTDGTTNNAGFITLSLESFPGLYPAIIGEKSEIILPSQTITGTGTLKVLDSTGQDFSELVAESATPSGVTVNLSLAEQAGQVTSQSLTVTQGTLTVTLSGLTNSSSGFTAGIAAGSVLGSMTVNADGSGTANATDAAGPWILSWNASLYATLTAPGGQTTSGPLPTFKL